MAQPLHQHTASLKKPTSLRLTLALPIAILLAATGIIALVVLHAATSLVGDINGDGVVNINDLSILLSKWGTNDPNADLDHNGKVDITDLSILISHWGQTATSTPTPTATPVAGGTPLRGGTSDMSNTTAYPTTPLIGDLPFANPPANAFLISGNTAQAIRDAVDGKPAGTVFKLSANTTYTGNSATGAAVVINPKAGDKFYGQQGSEIDGAQFLAVSGGDNVGFYNIIFKNTHTPISGRGVIDNNSHSGGDATIAGGWDIENSWFDNNSYGVELGDNSVARNNVMSNNICRGGGNGGTGTIWEYNEFIGNDNHNGPGGITDANGNYGMDDPHVNDCGGFKSSTSGDTFRNNLFIRNGAAGVGGEGGYPGPGLWFDFGTNATVTDNVFFGNYGSGVNVEARNDPAHSGIANMNLKFSGNIFAGNGSTAYPCGIYLQGPNGNTITGNYFMSNLDKGGGDCSVKLHERGDCNNGVETSTCELHSRPSNNTITGNWMTVAPDSSGGGSGNNISGNTIGSASGWTIPGIAAGPQK